MRSRWTLRNLAISTFMITPIIIAASESKTHKISGLSTKRLQIGVLVSIIFPSVLILEWIITKSYVDSDLFPLPRLGNPDAYRVRSSPSVRDVQKFSL